MVAKVTVAKTNTQKEHVCMIGLLFMFAWERHVLLKQLFGISDNLWLIRACEITVYSIGIHTYTIYIYNLQITNTFLFYQLTK